MLCLLFQGVIGITTQPNGTTKLSNNKTLKLKRKKNEQEEMRGREMKYKRKERKRQTDRQTDRQTETDKDKTERTSPCKHAPLFPQKKRKHTTTTTKHTTTTKNKNNKTKHQVSVLLSSMTVGREEAKWGELREDEDGVRVGY